MKAGWLVIGLVACGDNTPSPGDPLQPFTGLVKISGSSPFESGCNGAPQTGTNPHGLEVEPWVAVDPTNPRHLIVAWQQDRWSSGGANGNVSATSDDGGLTWTTASAPFASCEGGSYERSTDPWIAITADGTAYQSALVFDQSDGRGAMLVSRSTDGGASWEAPAVLLADDDRDVLNDKDSITADPIEPQRVYAVWDRLTGLTTPTLPIGTGPTMFARATAGIWEPARAIFDPGVDAQTIGNVIVVLPDGTFVDCFDLVTQISSAAPTTRATIIRSTDHGDTWSAPIDVGAMLPADVSDTKHHVMVRTGEALPQIAVDPAGGRLYVVWEDAAGGTQNGIVVATSVDDGSTWSAPLRINQAPSAGAFGPIVAVTASGLVGVLYYDDRDDDPSDASTFTVRAWLVTSLDQGATWGEEALTAPFDLQPARLEDEYFLGDYQGLGASASELVPVFAGGVDATDPTDIFVRPLSTSSFDLGALTR